MPALAATLDAALDVLELKPLEFLCTDLPSDPATDRTFYVPPPPRDDDGDGLPSPDPAERFRTDLLERRQNLKLFLSGHIGSGKSTQINKLAADEQLRSAFSIVLLRIEGELLPFLDTAQLLFLMASAIFEFGHHDIIKDEDRRYLDEGRVLECYNDKTWYDVHPLLWKVLEPDE